MLTFMLGMELAFKGLDVHLGYPLFMGGAIAFIFAQGYVLLHEVRQSF